MHRTFLTSFTSLCMLSAVFLMGLASDIQPVEANGAAVCIRADGSVYPSSTPISTVDNVTYILTGNITSDEDGIFVERNNTILDGAGYKLEGGGTGIGIQAMENVTIRNMEIKSFGVGVCCGSQNTIVGNVFKNNGLLAFDHQNRVENNFVNGRPLIYLEGVSNNTVDDAGQVILVNCSNIRVENLDLSNAGAGVVLWETDNSRIASNNLSDNHWGIMLYKSSNNTISGNDIENITMKVPQNENSGIVLGLSDGNSIYGNNITSDMYNGISLWESSGNSIYANNLENRGITLRDSQLNSMVGNNLNNGAGFFLLNSSRNSIIGNTITSISQYAVQLNFQSSENRIYHNNFVNDTYFETDDLANFWDDGYPSGGNYWSDYNGSDANRDAIGDTPYFANLPEPPWQYAMNHPLMGMFYSFNTSMGYEVSVVSNSTIKDFEYFQSNNTIKMHVYNMTTNQTFGFVRICPQCGRVLSEEIKFCPYCGKELG